MSVVYVLWLLFAHFVGDYILQTGWQAQNKSKTNAALLPHVLTWLIAVSAAMLLYEWASDGVTVRHAFNWILFQGAAHFCLDFITSRLSARAKKLGYEKLFWMILGFDQWVHALLLLLGTHFFLLD